MCVSPLQIHTNREAVNAAFVGSLHEVCGYDAKTTLPKPIRGNCDSSTVIVIVTVAASNGLSTLR